MRLGGRDLLDRFFDLWYDSWDRSEHGSFDSKLLLFWLLFFPLLECDDGDPMLPLGLLVETDFLLAVRGLALREIW
jgi:hypothetical protein